MAKLNPRNFEAAGDHLKFYGANHYDIFDAAPFDGYTVTVNALDDDGFDTNVIHYAAATLSQAFAIVEALERGEEI